MLTTVLAATTLLCVVAILLKARHVQRTAPAKPVVLFETRLDPPFLRPVFTARGERDFHIDAPVTHARLLSGVLHLTLRSDAGGESVGFEIAVTNVELDWLRGEGYRHLTPECQLLVGPLPGLSDRLISRTAELHGFESMGARLSHVHAYNVTAVVCDPADDTLRIEVELPDGQAIRLAYDYAAATVLASLPTVALLNPDNVQPLAVRLAA